MWMISNKKLQKDTDIIQIDYGEYSFYTNLSIQQTNTKWLILGHAYQKQNNQLSTEQISQELDLFIEGDNYKNALDTYDGNFTLLHLDAKSFEIYGDRFGIRKFFYWISGDEFVISDDLKNLMKAVRAKPSAESMGIYALTYHFIGGRTIFENVYYNKPSEVIKLKDGRITLSIYWDAGKLLGRDNRHFEIEAIANELSQSVERCLQTMSENRISLSLTGGADTRNLLAILLSKGIKPHLYTYGNPKSADCLKAKVIAEGLGLSHTIYDIQINSSMFESYAKKIIELGQSLASIHRVHRLLAIESEKAFADVMFLGTLGGEFIKGVSEDDYIVPKIIYENWHRYLDFEVIKRYLTFKTLISNNLNIDVILNFLNNQPFFQGEVIRRKLFSLSNLTASLHDAQDINLYGTVMNAVFTPFLDIKYLRTVFASYYSFNIKERHGNHFLKRIDNPVYASKFLKQVYPPLLQYEYSGNHKPREVLANKYAAALIKAIRTKTRSSYPPNFPLSNWMVKFVERNLPLCRDYDILRRTFNLDKLLLDLKQDKHVPKESYWLRFTNPIMMMYILEEYGY